VVQHSTRSEYLVALGTVASITASDETISLEAATQKARELYESKRRSLMYQVCLEKTNCILKELHTLTEFSKSSEPDSVAFIALEQAEMALNAYREDIQKRRVLDSKISATSKDRFIDDSGTDDSLERFLISLPPSWEPGKLVACEISGVKYHFIPPSSCRGGDQVCLNPILRTLSKVSSNKYKA
jgi:hypothetical protein